MATAILLQGKWLLNRGVILAGPSMTNLADAVRAYEQELLQKADLLALGLKGLNAAAPERAAELVDEISARLAQAIVSPGSFNGAQKDNAGGQSPGTEPRRPPGSVAAAARGGADEIEDFILEILAENPPGLSVQGIVDSLDQAHLEIKRKTLVVRLHRMVQAGRVSPQAHGHYTLSEAERSHRGL
jgi:hypothetical protein